MRRSTWAALILLLVGGGPAVAESIYRWGLFSDCTEYGEGFTSDFASTPVVTAAGGCTLAFNYHLDFERLQDYEVASVEISVDGQDSQTVLDSESGTLVSAATWLAAEAPLPDGEVQITFVGSAGDGVFNTGTGWSIDDVDIDCPDEGVPATSGWGVVVLLVGISLALVSALLRQRRRPA